MARVTVDPVKLDAWRLFLTAHAKVIDALGDELERHFDLPLAWYEVLLYLSEAPGRQLRMHELAESRLLSRSAATRLIDRMEDAGLVCRSTCAEDRRGTFVSITDSGRDLFKQAGRLHLAGIDRLFTGRIDETEASVLAETFRRIIAALP
jgi:DNA-binding MarR family transcriptional regulator